MGEGERERFEGTEGWRECVEVRRWDDMAKVVGVVEGTPRVERYLGIVEGVLGQGRTGNVGEVVGRG